LSSAPSFTLSNLMSSFLCISRDKVTLGVKLLTVLLTWLAGGTVDYY